MGIHVFSNKRLAIFTKLISRSSIQYQTVPPTNIIFRMRTIPACLPVDSFKVLQFQPKLLVPGLLDLLVHRGTLSLDRVRLASQRRLPDGIGRIRHQEPEGRTTPRID